MIYCCFKKKCLCLDLETLIASRVILLNNTFVLDITWTFTSTADCGVSNTGSDKN